MTDQPYNAKDDGEQSYLAAIEAKRERGDDYYLLPDQDARLLRSIPEGVSRIVGCYLSAQRLYQNARRSFAHRPMHRPIVGHQDFCGSLQGIHIQDASSIDDADSGAKPSSAHRGIEA